MKLQYHGAFRNHGTTIIHESEALRRAEKGQWLASDRNSIVATDLDNGVTLRFDGTANLSYNADYEFTFSISDQELLDLFEMKFGLETTVLEIRKELFGEALRRRSAEGKLSPRIPLLPPAR